MGDRYYVNINCVYCNELNPDVWYAPTCSSDTFKCRKCLKFNFIDSNIKAIKIEDVTLKMVEEGFEENTMGLLDEEATGNYCKERFDSIKKLQD